MRSLIVATTIGLLGLVCIAAPAGAQTATTTTATTSTTTTTLLPHPFSPATKECVRQANATLRACRAGGGGSSCFTPYEKDYGSCFAPGVGVKCATKCATTEATCFMKLPTTKKSCRKTCATNVKNDRKACRLIASGDTIWAGGDAGCFTSAHATFDLCRSVCTGLGVDCTTALKFCVANCQNL